MVPIIPIVPIVPILCFINVETLVSSLEASDVFRQIAEGLHYIHMRQGTVPNTCAKAICCMEVCFCSWFLANTVSFCLFATYRFVGGLNPLRRSQEYGEGITSCSYLLHWPSVPASPQNDPESLMTHFTYHSDNQPRDIFMNVIGIFHGCGSPGASRIGIWNPRTSWCWIAHGKIPWSPLRRPGEKTMGPGKHSAVSW